MRDRDLPAGRDFRVRPWACWSVAIVALGVGVAALAGTLTTHDPRVDVLSRSLPRSATATATAQTPKAHPLVRSQPMTLSIPALGINTAVGTLGLQPDHQVMVPTSAHVVDWYIDGPTPGQIGSAVILGHVDSFRGPGTFFYLKDLKSGNKITVKLADGDVVHFAVVSVVQYSKLAFPDRLVFGSHGFQALQLVTCGGTFDHATGHYESNIVVFSKFVSSSMPQRSLGS
jgi:sortase (surface protein transpeptidase)